MDQVREFVTWLRGRLGILWPPSEAQLLRLVDCLAHVRLRYADVPRAQCRHRGDGLVIITMPSHLRGTEHDLALSHEAGHAYLAPGLSEVLRSLAQPGLRTERLARLNQDYEERIARQFVEELFLPECEVRSRPVHELVELTGCPSEMVAARLHQLERRDFQARLDTWIAALAPSVERPPLPSASRPPLDWLDYLFQSRSRYYRSRGYQVPPWSANIPGGAHTYTQEEAEAALASWERRIQELNPTRPFPTHQPPHPP